MRQRVSTLCLTTCLLAASANAEAAPAIEKERVGPVPTESNLSRDEALQVLVEGEQLLQDEQLDVALAKMLEAYIALEASDGAEAQGVKELRSWLVKALEALELVDEAATIRSRGSYVNHPLSVMPSTWFAGTGGQADSMTIDEAAEAMDEALGMLEQGNIEGLVVLLVVYEVIERELGAESEDAKAVRSFLVGLLETGGYMDEAQALRARGSVAEPTDEDMNVYTNTWLRILADSESPGSVLDDGGQLSGNSIKDTSDATDDVTPSEDWNNNDDDDDDSDDDDKPKVVEAGSVVPSVLIDLGIGTFQPEYGRKGLIWTAGLGLHWTLFTAKFFGMQLGGGGDFGRNRDKRWLADAHGELRLNFDFSKVYIRPEFGGGYDQLAGGKLSIAEAYHVAPAGYYHFGGTLGVRFAERFGIYARAVRLNRGDTPMPNETRVRGGVRIQLEKGFVDMAFVFTDFDARDDDPGARIFSGNLGIGF